MRGTRVIVPKLLQQEILGKIHEGHMGINKCRALANSAVYWPGISKQREELVRECQQILRRNRKHLVPGGKLSVPPVDDDLEEVLSRKNLTGKFQK